jgi:cell division protein FtsB
MHCLGGKFMSRPKSPPLVSGTQFLAIVVLTISIFLIVDLGRRATASYHVTQAEKRLHQEIAQDLQRQEDLTARRDHVASDAYVEEWAREQAHMIHPGDKPMILVTPQTQHPQVPQAGPAGEPAAEHVPNWYHWWLLFFDRVPTAY